MQPYQFRDLCAGLSEAYLCDLLDVSPATLRRWKTGKARIPKVATLYLRLCLDGDLSALGGDEWQGFNFGRDGKLYPPFFKGGFTPREITAMFFTTQDAWADKRDNAQIRRELVEVKTELEEAKKRAAFYKRQVDIESKMGLMLARIVD